MKKLHVLIVLCLMAFTGQVFATTGPDSVSMNPGYTHEIYYSMANGPVSSGPRNTWDIAFRTNIMSSSILINDGMGVVLYTYPNGDSADYSSTWDTSGMIAWTPLFNDPEDWENGAFSRNATGHPDYGWGVYNSITHNLGGDSCFVIKTRNAGLKKIWIVKKLSSQNTYIFRFANIDGSNPQEVTLNCGTYNTRDFVGYDLEANAVADFQPDKSSWDLLFTKYMSVQPDGTPYPVTGVLNNDGVKSNEFWQVNTSFMNWASVEFDSTRSPIGWDWKYFDMGVFSFFVEDSLVYFVKGLSGDVSKLVFTKFAGSSTGKIVFNVETVSAAGILQSGDAKAQFSVFPNPASGYTTYNVQVSKAVNAAIRILDMTGKVMHTESVTMNPAQSSTGRINLENMPSGLYLLEFIAGSQREMHKLLIQK
jgi:hypothetical protein